MSSVSSKINGGEKNAILKYAGGVIAWSVGSGFATGQEVLQFFSSFGWMSFGVILIFCIGEIWFAKLIMTSGFLHKNDSQYNHFVEFCGKKLGTFYTWSVPVLIFLLIPVMISGSGAIIEEYFGINHYVGSIGMALTISCIYLMGFENLLQIVSKLGPLIIISTIIISIIACIQGFGNIESISEHESLLSSKQNSHNWILSGLLYISLNVFSGSTYLSQLGIHASHISEAKYGGILGAFALGFTVAVVSTGILLNIPEAAMTDVPNVYLARNISDVAGMLFSVILVLSAFSSSSTMMWSVASRIFKNDPKKNKLASCGISGLIILVSLLPFSKLVAVVYPLVGYVGLLFIVSMLHYQIVNRKNGKEHFVG